ncbi:MAG: endonuclease/exonuclease/phosphatase family protein, partial [Deltaproteobacteria bacterium]|nr:endonuclease/exonuclease/phosphatase family protein [Deltaproteobacteria bacterium]
MRIATWNVNSVKARLPYLLDWLATREPDVLCLQELKVPDDKFPHEAIEAAGYHAQIHGQPRW